MFINNIEQTLFWPFSFLKAKNNHFRTRIGHSATHFFVGLLQGSIERGFVCPFRWKHMARYLSPLQMTHFGTLVLVSYSFTIWNIIYWNCPDTFLIQKNDIVLSIPRKKRFLFVASSVNLWTFFSWKLTFSLSHAFDLLFSSNTSISYTFFFIFRNIV